MASEVRYPGGTGEKVNGGTIKVKPALEAVRNYLDAKKIRYNSAAANTIWFSLLIPTPEIKEMPNRYVSCGIRVPEKNGMILYFSATVMAVDVSDELLAGVSSVMMKFQSSEFKAGRIVLHPDGTVFYTLAQFLCSGGTIDEQAIGALVATALLEIASIFMIRDETLKNLPLATVARFGIA